MDILTACEVLEVKRGRGEVFCLLKKIEIYNCILRNQRSSSIVGEEIRSQRHFVRTKSLCKMGIVFFFPPEIFFSN